MGFFKSIKGKMSNKSEAEENRPHIYGESSVEKQTYESQSYASAPVNSHQQSESYAPPPGPPPTQKSTALGSNIDTNPPPYESWLSIPDTSQLPPPPSLSNEYSPANNATYQSAEFGHKWCVKHALYTPSMPRNPEIVDTGRQGCLGFDPPPSNFTGSLRQLDNQTWMVQTEKKQSDVILFSTLPIYFAAISNPVSSTSTSNSASGAPVTFSYSVSISALDRSAGIAIGFACKPYPPFRLPGWHRGSLAVHSDDGNRYINDPWGGIDFTQPFQQNEKVRITMSIYPRLSPMQEYHGKTSDVKRVGTLPKCVTQVRLERNGEVSGTWDIHEERDGEKDEGVEGLQGEADLYVALGVFGASRFEVRFERSSSAI